MRLTADDVFEIPVPDHLSGYELENGELVEVSLPSFRHARLVAQVTHHLVSHVWIIHTDAGSATMYHADGSARLVWGGEALAGDPVLPGFRLPLARLFPEARPAT